METLKMKLSIVIMSFLLFRFASAASAADPVLAYESGLPDPPGFQAEYTAIGRMEQAKDFVGINAEVNVVLSDIDPSRRISDLMLLDELTNALYSADIMDQANLIGKREEARDITLYVLNQSENIPIDIKVHLLPLIGWYDQYSVKTGIYPLHMWDEAREKRVLLWLNAYEELVKIVAVKPDLTTIVLSNSLYFGDPTDKIAIGKLKVNSQENDALMRARVLYTIGMQINQQFLPELKDYIVFAYSEPPLDLLTLKEDLTAHNMQASDIDEILDRISANAAVDGK